MRQAQHFMAVKPYWQTEPETDPERVRPTGAEDSPRPVEKPQPTEQDVADLQEALDGLGRALQMAVAAGSGCPGAHNIHQEPDFMPVRPYWAD